MTITWEDVSSEELGEQYRHNVPNEILAELWRFDYDDLGERKVGWQVSLAKFDATGELVTRIDDAGDPAFSADEAKKWAAEKIREFMT